tara:strand:+ start:4116 stop:4289 length:174 start_codon:yes stop_codon:yes gene_type:complete
MELNNEDVKDELLKSANEKRKTYKQFKGDLNYAKQTPLKRGEYRVFDKKTGKYMSNK